MTGMSSASIARMPPIRVEVSDFFPQGVDLVYCPMPMYTLIWLREGITRREIERLAATAGVPMRVVVYLAHLDMSPDPDARVGSGDVPAQLRLAVPLSSAVLPLGR